MLADFLSIGFVVIICGLLIWLMLKLDDSDGLSANQLSEPVKFERLSTLQQLNLLINKLEELDQWNYNPCKTKLETLGERLKNVERFQIKSELIYKDELVQYEKAIEWMKSPAEYRKRCGPPKIITAYSPLTDSDMEQLDELILPPVDFTRVHVGPSVASGDLSLPFVDQWLEKVVSLMMETLDKAWDIKDNMSSWTYTDYFAEDGGLLKFLRRAIVVSAEEDTSEEKTIFILDFMVPPSVTLDRIPEVKATGLPIKPLRGLCCTPVKYTESDA